MAGHAATHQRIADASATDGSQNLSGINYGTRRNEDAGAMSRTLPISLNITGTSTMGGAQGFSGINYGTLNYGDTGARQG